LVLLVTGIASARTWYVKPDGTGDVPTISAAVDSAAALGDTVLLADGTFSGDGNREVDCLDKALVITSESGSPELCVVLCGCPAGCFERKSGFHLRSTEQGAQRLEAITVAEACQGVVCYSGSRPEIVNCIFRNNKCMGAEIGPGGAGMDCHGGSHPTIIDCLFEDNSATSGGGLACGDGSAVLTDVSFINNHGAGGGGAVVGSGATITDCLFEGNWAGGSPMGPRDGGGMSCYGTVDLVNCVFRDNRSDNGPGGGLMYYGGLSSDCLTVTECLFEGNCVTYEYGGGLAAVYWGAGTACVSINRCTFVHNTNCGSSMGGGALYFEMAGAVELENTVIAFCDSGPAISYNWYDPPALDLTCCNIFGNAGGDWIGVIAGQYGIKGNISSDPLFCDALSGDFTLQTCSPCLPGNHPYGYDCGLPMGAYWSGCACQTATRPTTWGAVKSIYR
jgi:predicted outer membrane repeat protein